MVEPKTIFIEYLYNLATKLSHLDFNPEDTTK